MVAIEVPSQYGWVVLGAGLGTFFTNGYLSAAVMSARTKYNIAYPNAYAIPGFHKNADEFNRVQRSHQNYLEGLPSYLVLTLLGGLKYPIANAIGTVCFCIGSILYQKGYVDTSLDASMARHKKGGPIKYIGIFTALYSTGALAYSLIKSS